MHRTFGSIASSTRTKQSVNRSVLTHASNNVMRRALLIFPIAAALAGCVNKKEECAQYAAGKDFSEKGIQKTYKRLGIKKPWENEVSLNMASINGYCSFYKN